MSSLHATTEFVAHVDDASAVLLRTETWADLDADTGYTAVSEPRQPLSEDFALTEESVVVNGVAFRRPQDGEWVATQESIESLVFGGLDETAGDFEARLVGLVTSPTG